MELFTIFANEIIMLTQMSTEAMTQKIAEYFKTQPVLKAWLFGSYAHESADRDKILIYERAA